MNVWLCCQQFHIYGARIADLVIPLCHWYLLFRVLTNFVLNCELYRFSANCYQADIPVYFFPTCKSYIITRNSTQPFDSGSSSEGSVPTVLQKPQLTFGRIQSVCRFIGLTGYLQSVCFSEFFSDKTACFLAKVPSPCILANYISFLLLL